MIAYPNSPLPADEAGQRLCEIFGQQRWDFIYALAPDAAEKPEWKTEKRYALKMRALYSAWKNPERLIGTRFDAQTRYALLDIDIGSPYHPSQDPDGIKKIQIALETIGITRTLVLQSSWSKGLWIYIPLSEPVSTFNLAVGVKSCLQTQGFEIKDGELEVFPNDKAFGLKIIVLYKGHRLPLQPGSGSFLLDEGLQPISDRLEDFFSRWDAAAAGQDIATIKSAIALAREYRKKRRKPKQIGDLEAWRNDLEAVISDGWTGYGQTNGLLKEIGCYGVVFKDLNGDQLADYIHQIAIQSPGYRQYCRHQKDIHLRSRSWARSVEKYYWPVGTRPKLRTSADNVVPFNQNAARQAQERIQLAVEQLEKEGKLPKQATARLSTLRAIIGGSPSTFYKYKSLWHPEHQPVIDETSALSVTENPPAVQREQPLEPSDSSVLQPHTKIMKCVPLLREGFSKEKHKKSSLKGVRGKQRRRFPQARPPALQPISPILKSSLHSSSVPSASVSNSGGISAEQDEVIRGIQAQMRSLNWTMEEISQFIANCFGGKRRYQLDDDELLMLLYHLRNFASP